MTTTAPSPVQSFLQEIHHEAAATRRLLEAVPADKLDWKPHEKSMSIGVLARHVAGIPGVFVEMLQQDSFDFGQRSGPPEPSSKDELLEVHDAGQAAVDAAWGAWTAEDLATTWRVLRDGAELMALPRAAVLRNFVCNHLVHHRGQLSVYLRLLDVPLPSVYGPTADVNPFG